jgi:BirA family biotin operon repressor/biotin-[acetyl-CoA-carboxylase] ligase
MSIAMEDPVRVADLRSALVGTRFASHIHHFPTIDSTSSALLAAALRGAPDGTVYIADEQTAGRGRGGHGWNSAPGEGLYLSVLVQPLLHLRDALLLSLATGLAARKAVLQVTDLAIDIRWPNDLMLGNRKCGGILVETAVEPGPEPLLRYAVIGIGINIHQSGFAEELQGLATSLRMVAPQLPLSRTPIIIALLRALDFELTVMEDGGASSSLSSRLSAASTWVCGKRVTVPEQGGYTGTTAGLDAHGYLLVDADDGTRRTVLSGGVREAADEAVNPD